MHTRHLELFSELTSRARELSDRVGIHFGEESSNGSGDSCGILDLADDIVLFFLFIYNKI